MPAKLCFPSSNTRQCFKWSNMLIWNEALKLICAVFARWSAFYLNWVIGYKTSSSQIRPWDAVTVSISAILPAEEIQALTSSEGSADERLLISGSFGRGSHIEQLRMHTQSNRKFSIQFPSNGVPSKPYLCLNILMLGAWSNKGWGGFIHWGDRLNILIGQYKTHTKLVSRVSRWKGPHPSSTDRHQNFSIALKIIGSLPVSLTSGVMWLTRSGGTIGLVVFSQLIDLSFG